MGARGQKIVGVSLQRDVGVASRREVRAASRREWNAASRIEGGLVVGGAGGKVRGVALGVVLLLCLSPVSSSRVAISASGGYTNIVIKIARTVPEDNCGAILRNIQALLDKSSQVLTSALPIPAHFRHATVVIPPTWRDAKCGRSIRAPTRETPYRDADIHLGPPHPVHGDMPFTRQSGGCGVAGDSIYLPHTFLMDDKIVSNKMANVFVHEWSKYRYGIFDERGFVGDPLYPQFYREAGSSKPTGATNVPLNGSWIHDRGECEPWLQENCTFVPNLDNKDVTCSIGNVPTLANVAKYCDSSSYRLTPSKQAVMCQGRSAAQVILQHSDFTFKRKAEGTKTRGTLLKVVREPPTKYVLLIETSATMADKDHWRWIHKAAHKFIRYDLPVNSNLAIVTFNYRAKVEHPMVQVTSDMVRARLGDTIPGKYHLSDSNETCVTCAMDKVMQEILRSETAGSHIIIITRGGIDSLDEEGRQKMTKYVMEDNVKISSVLIPSARYLPFYSWVSQKSGGRTSVIQDTGYSMDLLWGINNAFSKTLQDDHLHPTEMSETIHKAEYFNHEAKDSQGVFNIDQTLGRDTQFGIYVEDEEDHLIKSIKFTDSQGTIYGPYTKMSSTFDLVNLKTINFVGQAPPFSNPHQLGRDWRYSIEWSSVGGKKTRKSIVMVTSKPRAQDHTQLVSVKVWTAQQQSPQPSVSIFTRVQRGMSPVVGATVTVTVTVHSNNGTIFQLLPMVLVDDGAGDIDLVSGDGTYSGKLVSYPSSGEYWVVSHVLAGEDTYTVLPGSRGVDCCGSAVRLPKEKLVKTEIFSRTVSGPTVHLSTALDVNTPPSKIVDLGVKQSGEGVINVEWTAPRGAVVQYDVVFSDIIADLLDPKKPMQSLFTFNMSTTHGERIKRKLKFTYYNADHYIGVLARDRDGNRGWMSNLALINVAGPVVEATPSKPHVPVPRLGLPPVTDQDWLVIAIIAGILLVLGSISVASISYFCVTKKKSSADSDVNVASSGSSDQTDGTDASSFDSELRNQSPDHALHSPVQYLPDDQYKNHYTPPSGHTPYEDTKQDHYMPPPGHTPYEDAKQDHSVTPVYWSASQLLTGTEQIPVDCYQNQSYSFLNYDNPVQYHQDVQHTYQTEIPDEYCVMVSNLDGQESFRHKTGDKIGPPVLPKPRNITQV